MSTTANGKKNQPANDDDDHDHANGAVNEAPERDPDLRRALDLVELHEKVKLKHARGQDERLRQARTDVDRVWEELQRRGRGKSEREPVM